jgi:PTS system fructose-specific IIC component
MIRIKGTLHPENILLDLKAESREEAIHQVAQTLLRDSRVAAWEQFYEQLREQYTSTKINLQFGLTLPHTRTDALNDMVMAFGRLAKPITTSEGEIRFIMVIGIPETMDAEYLRLVGILMRVFRSQELRRLLLEAKGPAEIIETFTAGETGKV